MASDSVGLESGGRGGSDFVPGGGGEPEEDQVGLPGLRKILEREMRFVLRGKLPYKAARSCPAS